MSRSKSKERYFKPSIYNQTRSKPVLEAKLMNEVNLEKMKESRRVLTNVFTLLFQGKYSGNKAQAVFEGLKLVDEMVKKLNEDIAALEPEPEVKANEPTPEPATVAAE